MLVPLSGFSYSLQTLYISAFLVFLLVSQENSVMQLNYTDVFPSFCVSQHACVACLSGLTDAAWEAISKNSFLKDLAAAMALCSPVILVLTREEVSHSCLELDVKVITLP